MSDKEPGLTTRVPAGYLAVAALDEVSWRELGARRAGLLRAIGSAGPGELPAALTAALALAAVISEQDARARLHAADPDSPRACLCGFWCRGLAAINDHLDQFSLDGPDAEAHFEVTETFLAEHQAARRAGQHQT